MLEILSIIFAIYFSIGTLHNTGTVLIYTYHKRCDSVMKDTHISLV